VARLGLSVPHDRVINTLFAIVMPPCDWIASS
jgi:hypothetical protein